MGKILAVALIALVAAASAGAIVNGPTPADAHRAESGKVVCPKWKDFKNGEFSDRRTAHRWWKQAKRECKKGSRPAPAPAPTATPAPTPVPTPEPTPVATPDESGQADVDVTSVTLAAPANVTAGIRFFLSGMVDLRNDGPGASALVDTTFALSFPGDCSVSPSATIVANDTSLPVGVPVAVSRGWNVTCSASGAHDFSVTADAAIDALQAVVDPDPTNNGGSASARTQIQ